MSLNASLLACPMKTDYWFKDQVLARQLGRCMLTDFAHNQMCTVCNIFKNVSYLLVSLTNIFVVSFYLLFINWFVIRHLGRYNKIFGRDGLSVFFGFRHLRCSYKLKVVTPCVQLSEYVHFIHKSVI